MGLFGNIGGIIGGFAAKKASKKAEKAQSKGFRQAMDEQRQAFGQTEAQYNPYITAGGQGLTGYGNLVGIGGPEAQAAAIQQLQQSPYYQSLYRHGEEALLQNAAATGGLRGGNTQRSLADFGADTLSSTIDRQLQQLGGLATQGLGATGSLAGYRGNMADAISQLQTGQGAAKAEDYLRRGQITANQWAQGGALVDQAAAAIGGGIAAGGGVGAIGPGGAPFNWGAFGNSLTGIPGLFGGGAGAGAGGLGGFAGLGASPAMLGGGSMAAPGSFSSAAQLAGWGGI